MADDNVTPIRKAADEMTDSSGGFVAPQLPYGMNFRDYGSYGLRQYSGWVREEYLLELIGREGARTYREMSDNSSTVGSMLFAIQQAMRRAEWRLSGSALLTFHGFGFTGSARASPGGHRFTGPL
jgi:hypothetical protein